MSPVPIVRGTVIGVYIPARTFLPSVVLPLRVVGTTSNDVANIGVCHTSDSQATTVIDCASGSNEPNATLHVEATIGMCIVLVSHSQPHLSLYSMLGLAMQDCGDHEICHVIRCY